MRYLCTFPLFVLSDSSYQRKWVGGECVGTCANSGLDGKGGTGCPYWPRHGCPSIDRGIEIS